MQFIPYSESNTISEIVTKTNNKIGTVIVEPIQGETGIIMPPSDFLRILGIFAMKMIWYLFLMKFSLG